MRLIKTLLSGLLLLLVLVIGILFSLRNQQPVPLDLLLIQLPANSLALWLILALATGCLLGLLLSLPWLISCKSRQASLKKQMKQQKEELHKLRTLSLRSPE